MPADRLIHPRCGHSRKVSSLTDFEFRVWIYYILAADDFGVLRCAPSVLQAASDALEAKKPKQIAMAVAQLVACDLLQLFDHQGQAYLYQHDWQDWQKVRWPAKTINPIPPSDRLTPATLKLFSLHPGGKRLENSGSTPDARQSDERLTRETANGLRQTALANSEGGPGETAPFDVWIRDLASRYPANRVTVGYRTTTEFIEQFQKDTRKATVVWAEMLDNLENQKQGYEWRVKGMVPRLEKWLREGLWRQRHEERPVETLVTDRTAGTLAAAAEILKGRAS